MTDTLRDELDKDREADEAAMRAQREEPEPETPEPEPAPAEPEAPAEPAAQDPAPPPEKPAEPEPAKPDPKMVPLAALQETRNQLRETREQMAALTAKFEAMSAPKPAEPAPEKPDPEPNYADDPAEWLKWQDRQTSKKVAALEKDVTAYKTQAQERQQQEQQAQQYQQVLGHYAEQARTFAEQNPDWQDAYQHLMRSRVDELMQLGYQRPQAVAQLQQEELQIAVKSMAEGANPAERLYAVAKMRGYAPAKAEAPTPPQPVVAPKAPSPGVRAAVSKSLSAAPGAPASAPSLSELAGMSEEDYAEQVPSADAFRRMMGG